ncbi:MAG: dTDP-4-dehydrorhamnose reductase [Marinifilaceae bacterium]
MANILVTGGNGQLGNELRQLKFSALDTLYFTDIQELDITDKDAIEQFVDENEIDTIVNCAAYTAVDKAEEDKDAAKLINVTAVKNLAEVAQETDCLLIHISTDYVFDGKACTPYGEKCTTNPLSVYGETKLAGEKAIQKSGCLYLILRTSWLYSTFGKNFMKTIDLLSKERHELEVVFDQVGTPTYARDLAIAIQHIIEDLDVVEKQGVYHFSNEGVCSWYDFAHKIVEINGASCKITPVTSDRFPTKAIRPSFSVLNKNKIKTQFKIAIPHWEESLKECMTRYQNEQ